MSKMYLLVRRDGHNDDLEYDAMPKEDVMVVLEKFLDDPAEAFEIMLDGNTYCEGADEFWMSEVES